jgi:hypothetical protein
MAHPLEIKEEYDYTKHSLAKKGFYRTYIDETTGLEVEDVEYNEKCKKMQHLDLAKIYAKEAQEPLEDTRPGFFETLFAMFIWW